MNAKASVFLVFAVFALVVFPASIAFHAHLYADGSPFFVSMLETRTFDTIGFSPARMGHHIMTQAGVVAALRSGMSDINHLSWLYGIGLFYLPWLAFMLSAWLFLRASMPDHAVIVALMFCLLSCCTSFFVISESHLAASLFVLTLTVIVTGDLTRRTVQSALVMLWILSLSIYEFWAFFFPICLAVLLVETKWRHKSHARTAAPVLIILYVLGWALNAYSIIFSPLAINRDAMFGSHFYGVWRQLVVCSVFFVFSLLFAVPPLKPGDVDSRLRTWLRGNAAKVQKAAEHPIHLVVLALLGAVGFAAVLFSMLGNPSDSYALRTLNLVLPLLFAFFLGAFHKTPCSISSPLISHRVLTSGMLVVMCIASQARLFHTLGFVDFQKRVFKATQSNTGYVTVERALPGVQRYGWLWTYPTMSLLCQAMRTAPIKSIIYSPSISWQPFGPLDADHMRAFAATVAVPVEDGGLRSDQASECSARKFAGRQR